MGASMEIDWSYRGSYRGIKSIEGSVLIQLSPEPVAGPGATTGAALLALEPWAMMYAESWAGVEVSGDVVLERGVAMELVAEVALLPTWLVL